MTPREQDRSQPLSQGRFPGRVGRRVLRPLALAVTLGVLAIVLSGCSSWADALALGWPKGITPQAHLNRELWIGAVIASLVVGAIVYGLIFWRRRSTARRRPTPSCPASSATTCRWSWC